ncbi:MULTISPECIES: chromosome segregation ATPase [unclassified Nostoc]|uniref:chromosome segregation ATPase n=1 Tax=unclassified Nostoc TaxID=2593658 RepID=UPI002AD356AE|nr:chromosome segregation ATPase [Nostoc sp. DedQUE03]MDZ7974401.1 chromosome segregation ATPase [Nostoc sp. DedQUE03]MDZ8047721.1 chromosome segregation ATPase [Nostoc sp. DedQUE02]
MTERDIPDSWSSASGREPDQNKRLSRIEQFGETQPFDVPATGSTSKSVKRRKKNHKKGLPINSNSEETAQLSSTRKWPRWMKSWVWWPVLLMLIPGSVGFLAMAMLFKLPAAPNCPSIFWPLASASVRLHCAQLAASKQTVNDLLQAIALVKQLPQNHPLHGEINRFIEEWSRDILKLADESFQTGNLEEAIATARKIPEDVAAYKLVDQQVDKWQSIWSKAEATYNGAIAEVKERRWQSAFMLSAKMLRVDNQYWAGTKYDQLNSLIATAREDGDKLGKAESLANSKVVDNLLEAIKIAESIGQESYLYQKAQEAIPAFGRKMLELARAKLDNRDADEALNIARQIPESTKLQGETDDFIAIADAKRSAWIGNVSGLEAAIAQAQQIDPSRPVYNEAQQLIARWQLEIEDVANLEKARTLASQGTVPNLTAAIAQVQLIPASNPRGTEARQEIDRWSAQVETIEDQPYLDRAEQIAIFDDINSLQAAIAQASEIRRGRALYPEARKKIRTWVAKIQRIQDQPYLDQAQELAQSGNLTAAINAAQQIASSGRALSQEAQAAINDWEGQIRTRENWKKAQEVGAAGTPEALIEAIRLADRVSNNSILRMDANQAIDQWSQQLLEIARTQGQSDIARGIDIAKSIPRGSAAYSAAQEQIKAWQDFLNPQPEPQLQPESQPFPPSTTTGQ